MNENPEEEIFYSIDDKKIDLDNIRDNSSSTYSKKTTSPRSQFVPTKKLTISGEKNNYSHE